MSNPTALCEVDPEDALAWTEGRALVATGSPFSPVTLPNGKDCRCTSKPFPSFSSPIIGIRTDVSDVAAQTNNALIYPALGLGAILSRSRTISPSMIMAGVNALSSLSPALTNPEASLLPDLADVRSVSVTVTAGVVRQAVEEGNATDEQTIKVVKGQGSQTLEEYIRVSRWVVGLRSADVRPECGMPCIDHWSWSTRWCCLLQDAGRLRGRSRLQGFCINLVILLSYCPSTDTFLRNNFFTLNSLSTCTEAVVVIYIYTMCVIVIYRYPTLQPILTPQGLHPTLSTTPTVAR